MEETELNAVLTAICEKHGIRVDIDPFEYAINSPAAIDVEHDEEGNLVGIGIYDGKTSLYFTQFSKDQSDPNGLVYKLCRIDLIGHNGKGDFDSLRQWGIPVSDSQLVWDTELIAHIIDSSRKGYGLKKLAKEDLGIEYPAYEDLVGKRSAKVRRTLDKWPVEITSKYNALDCFVTYQLFVKQSSSDSKAIVKYFEELEKPVSYVFQALETRGVRIDVPYLKQLKLDLEAKQAPIKASILNELGNINLNSPKQLLGALHAKEIFPELKGKPSTDKRALGSVTSNAVVDNLLRFSELETLLSSFVYPYLERNTEVVHPFFNQCGTRTGRPSCSNPNLLQIPKKTADGKLVRRMFVPREGMLMGDCDFGQIEPRVMAHLSKDPVLCQMFNDGVDFHEFTMARRKINRDRAKVLNLSVGYRATKYSIQKQLGGSLDEAESERLAWWDMFPGLRRWQDLLIYDSKRSGFCTTLLGRRIKVDGLSDPMSWKREAAERQLINNITQGSAAEIMKKAMISLAKDTRLSQFFGLLVQVYDELLWESALVAEDEAIVVEHMENALTLDVPLVVDAKTGPNWADCNG